MRKLFFLFAVLLICVSWAAWTYRVHLASETLTRSLGVTAQVQDVELSTHGLILRGLSLGGSDDRKDQRAICVDSIRVTLKPWNLWQNPAHISELSVDGVYLLLDTTSWQAFARNWAVLFDHLTSKDSKESNAESHATYEPKTYVIDHVVITNIHVSRDRKSIPKLRGSVPALARLELEDVGSRSPRSLPQTVQLVLGAILENVTVLHPEFSNVADHVVRNADEELQKVMKSIKEQYHDTKKEGIWKRVRGWFDWM